MTTAKPTGNDSKYQLLNLFDLIEAKPSGPASLVGQVRGLWLVVEYLGREHTQKSNRMYLYRCKCRCGVEKVIPSTNLCINRETGRPKSQSCGCLNGAPNVQRRELVGEKIDRWLVVRYLGSHPREGSRAKRVTRNRRFLCRCDCGNERVLTASALLHRKFRSQSCGCQKKRLLQERMVHGGTKDGIRTKEYRTWRSMRSRCKQSVGYIKKGIKVCPEWEAAFVAFLEHVGPAPSNEHTLDRIDNAKGYEPGNVRWATPSQQARNKTGIPLIAFRGESRSLTEWAEILGIKRATLNRRLETLSVEEAFTRLVRPVRLPFTSI